MLSCSRSIVYTLCVIVSISQGGLTFTSDFKVTHRTTRMFSLLLLLLYMCLVLEAIVLLCLLNVIALQLQTYRTTLLEYDADRYMQISQYKVNVCATTNYVVSMRYYTFMIVICNGVVVHMLSVFCHHKYYRYVFCELV